MREIITKSGTVYTLDEGRITRQGDNTYIDSIDSEPFRFIGPAPEIGHHFTFTTRYSGQTVVTTKVVEINDLTNYCRSHDFFECIFCPTKTLENA